MKLTRRPEISWFTLVTLIVGSVAITYGALDIWLLTPMLDSVTKARKSIELCRERAESLSEELNQAKAHHILTLEAYKETLQAYHETLQVYHETSQAFEEWLKGHRKWLQSDRAVEALESLQNRLQALRQRLLAAGNERLRKQE